MAYTYDYPRPALTADAVVFCAEEQKILLIKRRNPPFQHKWALPGGFVDVNELPVQACIRELQEETGLRLKDGQLLGVYGEEGRDPRGWTVSVSFVFKIDKVLMAKVCPGSDSQEVAWYSISLLPELAFDHHEIIKAAGL